MAWVIEFDPHAKREFQKLDKQISKRLFRFLKERVSENPRSVGKPLKGSKLGEFWKYRVGDYRIIANIEDDILRIQKLMSVFVFNQTPF